MSSQNSYTPDDVVTPDPNASGITEAKALDNEESKKGHGSLAALSLAALGVVFGDIGTSPLYSMKEVFAGEHIHVEPTSFDVYGIISLVIWSITLIVTIKYVMFVMRADNEGEGGILALVALLKSKLGESRAILYPVILLGLVGAALFYGDSVITPAISVMSAVEGLSIVNEGFSHLVLPISVVVLTVLFFIQRWGTAAVGKAFGPVMVLWFATLGALGVPHIIAHPGILAALSPHHAIMFGIHDPAIAFLAMGAAVLTITGAEALYADMGHFGKLPIRLAWFCFVFPCLTLNYLGQGAMIIADPTTIDNPFYRLAPQWATLPLVALATLATVIASQAVISGAFSVSRQATRLGLLPRLEVKHTSKTESGQIYVGTINWLLFVGILILISVFQTSTRLAAAYGLAVTGTLILTTALFVLLAYHVWGWSWVRIVPFLFTVGTLEIIFFASNVLKFVSGGWLPVLIACVVLLIMTTWMRGSQLSRAKRTTMEGDLSEFIERVAHHKVPRIPGVAVFAHPNKETVPLALKTNVLTNRILHDNVIILSVVQEMVPHIRHVDRIKIHDLGHSEDGIVHVDCHVGFNDSQDIPKALALAVGQSDELNIDPDDAVYFLSVGDVRVAPDQSRICRRDRNYLSLWRKHLFVLMQQNQANRATVFHVPADRTIMMGERIEI
ncbi:MAG: potassium transporter Kup [Propionibacteriaceae bacterium]